VAAPTIDLVNMADEEEFHISNEQQIMDNIENRPMANADLMNNSFDS
jgi:hypothetical protein